MSEITQSEKRLNRLRKRYAAQLPEFLEEIEAGCDKVVDSHWDSAILQDFLQVIHRIAGSSASYGYQQIHTATKLVESVLNEILENPIGATSELQERLEMGLGLLRAAFQEDKQPNVPGFTEKAESATLRGARATQNIYLVEDDLFQAEEIAEQVSYFGYDVAVFTTLPDLIQAVKDQPPKAILMDVIFPEGLTAGPEAVIRLQKEINMLIPVIFISESSSLTSRLQGVRAGGEAYFTKPVDIGALVDVLDQLTVEESREPCRVLLVDDSVEMAEKTAGQLASYGMQTRIVQDPVEIMGILEDFQPNIILLDMYMPFCTGPELAKVIRQLEKHVITPIIYLSTEEDREQQLEALISDSEDYVLKSIEAERLKSIVQSRIDRFQQLRSLMVRDSLTGLYNHTTVKERLDQELSRASRQQSELCFVMIDLDHFKKVNDTYGHGAGDRVLKSLARLLTQRLRKTDVIGRYGGEEFAVILPETPKDAAEKLITELLDGFSHIHHRGGNTDFTVTFSAGIAAYPGFSNPIALIEAADGVLYQAKNQGRNRIVVK